MRRAAAAWLALQEVAWNRGARPVGERDLERCFGADFEACRAAVRGWLPRRHPSGGP